MEPDLKEAEWGVQLFLGQRCRRKHAKFENEMKAADVKTGGPRFPLSIIHGIAI